MKKGKFLLMMTQCGLQVTPEFSVRLLDEKYSKENATIQEIQGRMVDYFRAREGPLAQDGISGALLPAA